MDSFMSIITQYEAVTPFEIHAATRTHLQKFNHVGNIKVGELLSLHRKYIDFITNGLHHIRTFIAKVSPSEPHEFLQTYEFLINCLKVLSQIIKSKFILYAHCEAYIGFLLARKEYDNATNEIDKFLEVIGGIQTGSILPSYNITTDERILNIIWDILLSYFECLLQSEDVAKLVKLVEELDPWLNSFDEDMRTRTWIVKLLIETMDYNHDELTAKRFAVTLLEHAKVSQDVHMIEMGTSLVRKGTLDFFLGVLEQLALKCPLEIGISEETNEWATCMMQNNCGVQDSACGPMYFLQAQALCLRALCRYEQKDSEMKVLFLENPNDMDKALKLWTSSAFSELATKYSCISDYTRKLLLFAFDILITEHYEDGLELLDRMLPFFEEKCSSDVGMLWQFKNHHSHLESKMIHDRLESDKIDQFFADNYEFLMEEGETTDNLEMMVSNMCQNV
ncbi:hypothetical protein Tco_0668832 [Tanacetum coccineum]